MPGKPLENGPAHPRGGSRPGMYTHCIQDLLLAATAMAHGETGQHLPPAAGHEAEHALRGLSLFKERLQP